MMVWYDRTVYYIPYTVRPPDTHVIKCQMYLRMHNNYYVHVPTCIGRHTVWLGCLHLYYGCGSSCTVARAYYSAYSVPQIFHAAHLTLWKLHTCGHYKPHKLPTPNAQLLQFLLKLP